MRRLEYESKGFYTKLRKFIESRNQSVEVTESVATILEEIKKRGDRAVCEYTRKFDGYDSTAAGLRIPEDSIEASEASLTARQRKCIRDAIRCVREFHREGMPKTWRGRNPHGASVGETWYPIDRVGIYIPAGSTPLVSTVVMTTTLAKLAGVPSIAVFTPANREGKVSSQMLAGLSLCGISEVYRVGGAQAIGAMAYGTKTISRVAKIMGPGNAYVTEAQRQVYGQVGVDLLPGPSEALVIADETARIPYLAADLLAQAEHGSGREKVYFIYSDTEQAEAVQEESQRQMKDLKHEKAIRHVWKNSTLFIHVPNLEKAAEVASFIAPEHLELHVAKKHYKYLTSNITTAGAILCGHETPTVLGDFTAGPSHTLPTGGTGRFFSGLKIQDFLRRSSIVEYDRKSLDRARDVVAVFAELEDLDAHGHSLEIRYRDTGK